MALIPRLQWYGLPCHAQEEEVREMGRKERGSQLGPQGNREANPAAQEGRKGNYSSTETFV